ncbi:MAG: DUF2089 family protein [bacterium]|nr:DUF2089 family protein [bacterium]
MNTIPVWLKSLSDEDIQFLKRFVLASGSLKALAEEYGISYPTVRTRLDRLIEKIKAADHSGYEDDFHRAVQLMIADGSLPTETARRLLQAHRDVVKQKQTDVQSVLKKLAGLESAPVEGEAS